MLPQVPVLNRPRFRFNQQQERVFVVFTPQPPTSIATIDVRPLFQIASNVINRLGLIGLLLVVSLLNLGCCGPRCFPSFQIRPAWWPFGAKVQTPFIEPIQYSLFRDPELMQRGPQRVLLVPTGIESGRYQAPAQMAEALAAAIRAAGISEVVFPPELTTQITVDRILAGQFSEREIISLCSQWQCDGVMFIRVNQVQAFSPLSTSMTAALVEANESVVLFAIDGNWDTSDPHLRQGFERFVKRSAFDGSESEYRLQLQSPSRLFAYIGHQTAAAWKGTP